MDGNPPRSAAGSSSPPSVPFLSGLSNGTNNDAIDGGSLPMMSPHTVVSLAIPDVFTHVSAPSPAAVKSPPPPAPSGSQLTGGDASDAGARRPSERAKDLSYYSTASTVAGGAGASEGDVEAALMGGAAGVVVPPIAHKRLAENDSGDGNNDAISRRASDTEGGGGGVGVGGSATPPVRVSEIPTTPISTTPSLGANPKHLTPLPVKTHARLTNTMMERLAREAAARQFRENILLSRIPAPNVLEEDAMGGAGGSESFNAAVAATSSSSNNALNTTNTASSSLPAGGRQLVATVPPGTAANSPTRRRKKGTGVVTVLSGLKQSLTAAGVLLFAGYTPEMLQAVQTTTTMAMVGAGSRRGVGTDGGSRAASPTGTPQRPSPSRQRVGPMSDGGDKGDKDGAAAVNVSNEDPVDDLISEKKRTTTSSSALSPHQQQQSQPFRVTSAVTAPSVGTSKLNPTLKAVRLQQTLLSQELPLGILHADVGIDLAWVQSFMVDGIVYPIYCGEQLGEAFIAAFDAEKEREKAEAAANSNGGAANNNADALAALKSPRKIAAAAAAAANASIANSQFPLLDVVLQKGKTVPIQFDKSGSDIPLEILERAAAGDPIVLAEDSAGYDDMGEHVRYGKRNLVDFVVWRNRTVDRWEEEYQKRNGTSGAFVAVDGDRDDADNSTTPMRRRRKSHGHGMETDEDAPEDEEFFGAIDSPRSALVCYRHGLRVASWNTLTTPDGIPRLSSVDSPDKLMTALRTRSPRSGPAPTTPRRTGSSSAASRRRRGGASSAAVVPFASAAQSRAVATAIANERSVTDSLLPIVEDYKLLCRTITQKYAIYCMCKAALAHMSARVPIPRNWAEVHNSFLGGGLLATIGVAGGLGALGSVQQQLLLTNAHSGAADGTPNSPSAKRRSVDAQLSEIQNTHWAVLSGGGGDAAGLIASKSPTNRRSASPPNHQGASPPSSTKEYIKAPYGTLPPPSPNKSASSMRTPSRGGAPPPRPATSMNTSSNNSSAAPLLLPPGLRAATPMADLHQRHHDDLLIEWGRRQQVLAHELFIDRRVAKSIDKRREERIRRARACQTPIQQRRAAEREERIQQQMAVRDERRRVSIAGISGGKKGSSGNGNGAATSAAEEQQRLSVSAVAALEALSSHPTGSGPDSRIGTGHAGSRYHPDRYRPLLADSDDEDAYSMCSNSSCSECEISRRRQSYPLSLGGGGGGAARGGGKRGASVSILLGSSTNTGGGGGGGGSHNASSSALLSPKGSSSASAGGGGNKSPRVAAGADSHSLPNNRGQPTSSPISQLKRAKRGGERSSSLTGSSGIDGSATTAAMAKAMSEMPNAPPSELFLAVQREREKERVARTLAAVHRKDAMAEEALKRKTEGLELRRLHNTNAAAKADEVNARLERKNLFSKLIVANKCQQQEHKDAEKKAMAEERARQVSNETKAKGSLTALSRDVFAEAKVNVHKSLFLQEKLNADYRAKNNRSEYHHGAQPQQQFGGGGGGSGSPTAASSPMLRSSNHNASGAVGSGAVVVATANALSPLRGTPSAVASPASPPAASSLAPPTTQMVELMFNQAVDARKAVSRNALSHHLSKERTLVARWQQLEQQTHANHYALNSLAAGKK